MQLTERPSQASILPSLLRSRLRAFLSALVVLGLATALVVMVNRDARLRQIDSARSSALAAGRQYAIEIGTYDYRSLPQGFRRVEADSTSTFATVYARSAAALASELEKYKAISKGTVTATGIESASTSRAAVLVYLTQTSTTTDTKGSSRSYTRLRLVLLHVHGRWLVNQVDRL